ncbi:MAG: ATP-binding protein [Steroidobacteraceae bacterium]|jgi:two-component system sensor histidine kinase CpxA|nr:ATP-binding protein [Steroidobacteraceae bacterium]
MNSLYARIFLSFWAVMITIVTGAVLVTWLVFIDRADDAPRMSAALIREAAQSLRDGGEPALRRWLQGVRERSPELRIFIVDEGGRELLGRPLPPHIGRRMAAGLRAPVPEVPGVRVVAPQPLPLLVTADGRRYGVLVLPPRSPFGVLNLPVTRGAILVLALLATGLASWWLTRSITRPVSRLSEASRAIAAGNLDVRVADGIGARRDELGVLAHDFDAMAARLRELLRAKERLLRDISHELRSPLARMRVALGLARQPGGDVARQLDRLEAEAERLDRLIGQVLHLARLDAPASDLLMEEVDLVELVEAIARDASYEAQGRGVRVAFAAPAAPVRVRGEPRLLASAVENVVRNALRYTGEGTEVELAIEAAATDVCVSVRDRGPGVPEAELERIFEPFHRVAESRERESGGDGIGLAIASRVLAVHGGSARARNREGGGLEVRLHLPLRGAAPAQRNDSSRLA